MPKKQLRESDFDLLNKDGQAVLYLTDDPSYNVFTFRIINNTGADLALTGGPPAQGVVGATAANGSTFNFNFETMLTADVVKNMKITLPDEWAKEKIDPSFSLSGINIAYKSGPVNIGGGFLKKEIDGITQYFGSATIGVTAFSLTALGAYANYDGHPSLFIFAMLTRPPLGGPPAFFVTGVAAGFGYNRGLKLPGIDDVSSFPWVSGFVPGQSSPFSGGDPNAALQVLIEKNVVPVQLGQNWIAAGVQFTSFELLQSYALLSVAFGTKLEIGLLGLSAISVPPKAPVSLAYAELAIDVRILPNEGLIAVDAKLTQASYVLSKACQLTGGFAFYLWTAPNEFEGDFVVTLGGYHPNFKPPAHYPAVPRLGFNWVITSELNLKGEMYFALTPTCLMAGGLLEANFHSGNLKAWFKMGADFLIGWKPFHYEAHLYLSFGVSYTFEYEVTAVLRNAPKALWQDGAVVASTKTTLDHVLVGFLINPITPPPDATLAIDLVNFQFHFFGFVPDPFSANPKLVLGPNFPDPMKKMQSTINDITVSTTRKNILDALVKRKIPVNTDVNVVEIAENGNQFLLAPPVLAYEYWQKP